MTCTHGKAFPYSTQVLENVKEVHINHYESSTIVQVKLTRSQMWTEVPKGKNKKSVNKDRFISKMFLRYAFSRPYNSVY